VSALSHLMLHDAALHSTWPEHVFAAKHLTAQSLPPQAIPWAHAPAPAQRMSHELAALQSIPDVHEFAPTHCTLHGIPGGQAMGPVHVPAAVHVTVHVPNESQVPTPASEQMEGHATTGSTAFASRASPPPPASPAWLSTAESTVESTVVASTGPAAASPSGVEAV
jgi:hypothetical protein